MSDGKMNFWAIVGTFAVTAIAGYVAHTTILDATQSERLVRLETIVEKSAKSVDSLADKFDAIEKNGEMITVNSRNIADLGAEVRSLTANVTRLTVLVETAHKKD